MNVSQIVIRPTTQNDLLALEWDGEYKHFRRLYSEIFQSASRGKAIMWVAELPGTGIIGQLFVQLTSARLELANGAERAYIYGFRIKPDFRGRGLGRRMMQVAEDDLAKRCFRRATLNVARDNPQARRLYESLGYQVVGMDPGQWTYIDHLGIRREVREPAWRMEKQIGEA
jgi:ribosomal protein S18 acetylase RimI-like enzyme